jgi:nucleoside-diphosphate-sugar epimerase
MDNKQKSILVIGASGGVGGAVASNMARRGWRVIGLSRVERPAQKGIEWRVGDAMSQEDLVSAAKGVDVVFYGANPPKYKNWDKVCLPMVRNAIAAAEAAGARLAFPGTVYNFDIDDTGELVAEDAPQFPKTRKGAIRVAMEAELEAFAERGGRVLILRAGDYFGSNVANSWFQGALVKPGQEVGSITYPGAPELGHAWAFLPDVAETFGQLLDREAELGAFERFHFEGHWMSGDQMADALRRAAKKPDAPVKRFPWWAVVLTSPFIGLFREMLEMRYLWQKPLRLDNRRLTAFLGAEPHTPLEEALRYALVRVGCLAA